MKNNPWLRLIQIIPMATCSLICFPFAGGQAEYYLPWQKHMPNELALCPIQLPGRSYRLYEPAFTDIQSLLQAMLPAIKPLLNRPYCLFGHSMGGYIAYEFIKAAMLNHLLLPIGLVVSAVPAPNRWLSRRVLSQVSDGEFRKIFFDLGGFRPELIKYENFIDMQLALLRQDILLCESCQYQGPAKFPFPIIALGANDDDYVPIDSLSDWRLETSEVFKIYQFSGGHFFLNQNVTNIISIIKELIIQQPMEII